MSYARASQANDSKSEALREQIRAAGLGCEIPGRELPSIELARASVAQLRDISRPEIRDAAKGLTEADALGLARALLTALGRSDHPDIDDNPIFGLYQVALDYRCSADGYRALFDQSRK